MTQDEIKARVFRHKQLNDIAIGETVKNLPTREIMDKTAIGLFISKISEGLVAAEDQYEATLYGYLDPEPIGLKVKT